MVIEREKDREIRVGERLVVNCTVCGQSHHPNFHNSSNGHKFSGEIRDQARKNAEHQCSICGKKNSSDVHHMLAIWAYKIIHSEPDFIQQKLNKDVLKSIHNAVVVCEECHSDLHLQDEKVLNGDLEQEIRLDFYRQIAIALLHMYY